MDRRAIFFAAAFAAFVMFGCDRPKPDNVIVVLVDTLRSDHLGCYGYPRPTSPNIDRFAASAYVFDAAVAQSSWTAPSVASLFTSLYPSGHGVTSFGAKLAGSFDTLAEVLRRRGLKTAAFSANMGFVNRPKGFAQGFDTFELVARAMREDEKGQDFYGHVPASADEVTNRALDYLEHVGPNPFFLYLHYLDPHLPYDAPSPFGNRFVAAHDGPADSAARVAAVLNGIEAPNADDVQRLVDLYDGEIAYTDDQLGRLFEYLRASGLLERSLVVLVSDHGEELFDHGGFSHGSTLFREMLDVPLVVRPPGASGGGTRIPAVVQLIDVGPTILDELGAADDRRTEGHSFSSLLSRWPAWTRVFSLSGADASARGAGAATPDWELGYSELSATLAEKPTPPRHNRSVLSSRWHYLVDGQGSVELYDHQRDRAEVHNLAGEQLQVVDDLADALRRHDAANGQAPASASPAAPLGEKLRERLRAFGYVQ